MKLAHGLLRSSLDGHSVFVKVAVRYASTSAPTASSSASTSSPDAAAAPAAAPASKEWTAMTRRTGAVAVKKGMTCMWDADGNRLPVTVLHLDNNQVISTVSQTINDELRHFVTIGCKDRRPKTVSRSVLGQFKAAGTAPKRKLATFEVTEDALAPLGTTLSAAHFVPGQYVDVQAPSIGKGFQGVMKRHGFKGLRASHGVSVSHRSPGSTGMNQDPGRVFPGKKMPGRMGGLNVTTQNLLVHKIDTVNDLVYVHGHVPGSKGAFVKISDALKKMYWQAEKLARKGLQPDGKTDFIGPVKTLPLIGDDKLAKKLPAQVEYLESKSA